MEATIKLEFNGREVEAPAGVTVHRAAEINGINIPTLCSHKSLSPYGGCRMCIVEIEGMRGYPLSCNTTATEGMKVLTDTVAIHEIRREVLQLILSEHPSSCLVCEEKNECEGYNSTTRKAGVTTSCRYCPNNGSCELQDLVDLLEITEIDYPILYRGYEKEKEDPFYDRDYNICILCGRCIRMCQEIRGTGVLSFNYRGPNATVGPAFGRNHIEAGCEFCGACVTVCPTGALAEKASKWDEKPESTVSSTCPYCAIGCQLDFWQAGGRFSRSQASPDDEVNDGQACLKGSFCIGEVSHHFERARKPFTREDGRWKEKLWDEAIDIAAEKIKAVKPDEFAMLVSGDLTNEGLYAAQKFTRLAAGTNSIDTTARLTLGGGLGLWSRMFAKPISFHHIRNSSRILAVDIGTRFNFSIVGVEVRKALKNGAQLVTIDPRESNLARDAHVWVRPKPGTEGMILRALVTDEKSGLKKITGKCDVDIATLTEAQAMLKSGEDLTVILGPTVFNYSGNKDLLTGLDYLIKQDNVDLIPLYIGANTRGAFEMGTFPEFLPGAAGHDHSKAVKKIEKVWSGKIPKDDGITADKIINGKVKPKVLYLVGTAPFFKRPECEFLIVQDIYEPGFDCDLYLPAQSHLEDSGTLVNIEGRVQASPRIEELPDSVQYGRARSDWWIFSQIAQKLGVNGFKYESGAGIRSEIAELVPEFPGLGEYDRKRRVFAQPLDGIDGKSKNYKLPDGKFVMVIKPGGYGHRGVCIVSKVEGLEILKPERGFFINPDDACELGLAADDIITITAGDASGTGPVKIAPELPPGVINIYVPESFGGLDDGPMEPLYRLKDNPVAVEVSKSGV